MDNSRKSFSASSENMRFASSVAGLGLLLKGSQYSGDVTYQDVRMWGDGARTFDPYGFREEFITLVDQLRTLD